MLKGILKGYFVFGLLSFILWYLSLSIISITLLVILLPLIICTILVFIGICVYFFLVRNNKNILSLIHKNISNTSLSVSQIKKRDKELNRLININVNR